MFNRKYKLKDSSNRKIVDLTDPKIIIAIKNAVAVILPQFTVNVYAKYFEIIGGARPSDSDLRMLGKEIAANSYYLNSIKKNGLFIGYN